MNYEMQLNLTHALRESQALLEAALATRTIDEEKVVSQIETNRRLLAIISDPTR